jgi:hypothetical protein
MITRISTTFAFGWKKFGVRNYNRSKWSPWITLRFISPLVSAKLSKMSAVNCSIPPY